MNISVLQILWNDNTALLTSTVTTENVHEVFIADLTSLFLFLEKLRNTLKKKKTSDKMKLEPDHSTFGNKKKLREMKRRINWIY